MRFLWVEARGKVGEGDGRTKIPKCFGGSIDCDQLLLTRAPCLGIGTNRTPQCLCVYYSSTIIILHSLRVLFATIQILFHNILLVVLADILIIKQSNHGTILNIYFSSRRILYGGVIHLVIRNR